MIKILYFLNSTVRGGVEEHVLSILEKLDRTRFEPVLVCPQALLGLMGEELQSFQVRSHAVSIRNWFDFAEIRKFRRILKEERPRIVHSHLFKAAMFAAPIAKRAGGIRVVDTAHIREGWRKGIKKAYFIDRWIYRHVDEIIAVSHAVKRYLIEEKKLPPEKITVVHNGVHLEKFRPSSPRQVGAVGATSDQNGRLRFGVIGRLEPQKGHRYFLEAVRLLEEKGKEADFVIIGEGRLRHELEEAARHLGVEQQVRFLGFRKDIVRAFEELDVLVLPSLFEGLPLVALEASAMGKAVIVTDVDGSPEVVINNETGIVVPARDSVALKEAMERLLARQDLVAQFGQKARARVEKEFDVNKQVRETEEVYLKCSSLS
jgi:glycosyltransferase involved in cell wall biosynthesis